MASKPSPERILVVEDDSSLRATLAELLDVYGFQAATARDGREALRILQQEPMDLVLTDLRMPGMGGEALLEQVRAAYPETPVVAMTSFGSVEKAVEVTRAGAADFLTKPLQTQALLDSLARVLEETRERRQAARERRLQGPHLEGVVGRSRPMVQLFKQVARVAPSRAPVLITGETGAGKEVVARALHRASGREPFLPLNCGALPANLIESELFGYARGAFTGAERDKRGLFEAAEGGTIFLDEIAELPLALQAKLLRVLQSGEVRRVGEVEARQVEARVIAATNRDLPAMVREGTFREDLWYRINVIRLEVPPLRERLADIPLLAERFLAQLAGREGWGEKKLSAAALAALVAYPWPGNVRELQNVLERAAIFAEGPEIGIQHIPEEVRSVFALAPATAATHPFLGQELTLAEVEQRHILAVLERVGGNRTRAAQILGIPRRTLYHRLEEYGVGRQG